MSAGNDINQGIDSEIFYAESDLDTKSMRLEWLKNDKICNKCISIAIAV